MFFFKGSSASNSLRDTVFRNLTFSRTRSIAGKPLRGNSSFKNTLYLETEIAFKYCNEMLRINVAEYDRMLGYLLSTNLLKTLLSVVILII